MTDTEKSKPKPLDPAAILPPVLLRAMRRRGDYVLQTTTGTMVEFSRAEYVNEKWIKVSGVADSTPYEFDVRLGYIVWTRERDIPD